MSLERVYHCDGPDCGRHVRTGAKRPPCFLVIYEDQEELHFCGWDCVLRHAASKEPETVVPGSSHGD